MNPYARAAARGRSIVHSNERYRQSTNTLGDILLDLMHYALLDGSSAHFDQELEWARKQFQEDITSDKWFYADWPQS